MNKQLKDIVKITIVAALYVVLTYFLAPISFSVVQVRLSEILVLLVFFNKKYSISMIVGCAIANLFSPYGMWDVIFGTLGTVGAVVGLIIAKKLWVGAIFPVISNGLFVGIEIAVLDKLPFVPTALSIMAGEAICMVVGCVVMYLITKNEAIKKLISE